MTTKIKPGVIADAAVENAAIASNAVTTDKVALDTLTAADLAPDSVAASEIAADAVGSSEIAAGAVGTSEIADGSIELGDLSAAATPAFTKSYTSSNQTITSAGSLTLAHGLGAMPSLVQVRLKCTTADNGYSVNDELVVNPGLSSNGGSEGVVVVPDATNLNIRFGSAAGAFKVLNKGTGAAGPIVNTSWAAIFKAWA